MEAGSASVLIAPVAVDSYIVSDISFAGAAESFDGEHIAFLHALVGLGLDEGDLFVAMDLVAEDVVACDTTSRSDGNGLSVELDLVALHHFLDGFADVVYPSVNPGFLQVG